MHYDLEEQFDSELQIEGLALEKKTRTFFCLDCDINKDLWGQNRTRIKREHSRIY